MKIRTLLVDDEPMARGVIKKHLAQLDAFVVVKECDNAIEAINFLQKESVDLIFLDIQMPEISGISFLKALQKPPLIVLATAYSDYGVDSYEYENVIDYLLKPISFERFLKTATRISDRFKTEKNPEPLSPDLSVPNADEIENLYLKSDKKIHKIPLEEVLYLQGYGNYVKVFTKSRGMIIVLQKLQEFEDKLPKKRFIRVHKSFIVALSSITSINGNRLLVGNADLPIGITYKKSIEDALST